jgi:hypothetical protein
LSEALSSIAVRVYKNPVNPISNPNPIYSHSTSENIYELS